MRFELTVALKYLIPRWRQLSTSIISLVSIGVISLVVWLVIVFLSVTEGLEKKWIEELVAISAPLRMRPTEAYYNSYYYQIDNHCLTSNYTTKSIGEKLASPHPDPYDPLIDAEIPHYFPAPDTGPLGAVRDLVKEGYGTVTALDEEGGVRPQEYEVSYGSVRLALVRDHPTLLNEGGRSETFLNQVSYVASYDPKNERLDTLLLPPTSKDLNNLLIAFSAQTSPNQITFLRKRLQSFFEHITIHSVTTSPEGWVLPKALYPEQAYFSGCGVVVNGEIQKIVIPQEKDTLALLKKRLLSNGCKEVVSGYLHYGDGQMTFFTKEGQTISANPMAPDLDVVIEGGVDLPAALVPESLNNLPSLQHIQFKINALVQENPLSGQTPFKGLKIGSATAATDITRSTSTPPPWLYRRITSEHETMSFVPTATALGEGIVLPKTYRENGVVLGDTGTITYYGGGATSPKEQQVTVFVAGFYDPGLIPVGNKLLFASPSLVAMLRSSFGVKDNMLGNGINIWVDRIDHVDQIKDKLIASLDAKGLTPYFEVESYADYEFAKPIVSQLRSDKLLFTLIAVIILVVACSNVISMLILLVNDKKKEIGILQSMGASPSRIAAIFGLCGFITGLISCIIGTVAALFTLHHLQSLINFLSYVQGRDAFQSAFYGSVLPNSISPHVLVTVVVATTIISLLAGIIPAIKAARIRPSEILRSE